MDSWEKIIPEFVYNPEVPYFDILVPTMDTVRYGFLFEKLVSVKHPVLYTGTTGVGKSVITKGCLKQLQEKGDYVGTVMNFSAQTSSLRTQEIIESKLEKKRKTILGIYVCTQTISITILGKSFRIQERLEAQSVHRLTVSTLGVVISKLKCYERMSSLNREDIFHSIPIMPSIYICAYVHMLAVHTCVCIYIVYCTYVAVIL